MSTEVGLRERKKLRTRLRIAETAVGLFAERGFDRVTVADIARHADVSEATVFNYFPTKEDLIYGEMQAFEAKLLDAVRNRAPGESVLAAFRAFVLQSRGLLATDQPEAREKLATIARITMESQALRARERQIYDETTRALAELIAQDVGAREADIEPWVVANALMGVHRALKDHVHRQVLAGKGGQRLARDVLAQGRKALALLEDGLGAYSAKRRRSPTRQ